MKSKLSPTHTRIFFSIVSIALVSGFAASARDDLPRPNFACAMRRATKLERSGIREKRICTAMDRSYLGLKKAGSIPRDADLNCKVIGKNQGSETAYLQAVALNQLPNFLTMNLRDEKVLAAYTNGADTLILYKPKKAESKLIEAEEFSGNLKMAQKEVDDGNNESGLLPASMETSDFDCVLLDLVSDVEEEAAG